jgi:geranylgeranyl pyrophosphate synthase
MAMDGVAFAAHRDRLRALLATRLAPATLALFRDLPAAQSKAIADVVAGGKQLRAELVVAVCDALGGLPERALPSAAAIECVHAASLVHDDLVDGDRTRRDRPAAWVVHGSRRAVLLADIIFATSLRRAAELGRSEVATLSRAIAMLAAGAYGEPLAPHDVEARDAAALYERTIRLKTGSLFSAAAELGAIAARSRPAVRAAACDFGAHIGDAFQLADDRDDVIGDDDRATPQRQAALAMLVARFGNADSGRIARAMQSDIDRRIALACDALAPFPRRAREVLCETARAIVRPPTDVTVRSRIGERVAAPI